MNKQEAKERIAKLRESINHHRYLYHVHDTEEISEAALDSLKHELFELEQDYPDLITKDSPTQRVGGVPLDKFHKISHQKRMLSMEDVFSFEELQAWEERFKKYGQIEGVDYYCMVKLDGLALSLIYKDGVLQTAATRGDGKVGEDVTSNAKTIESIPLQFRKLSEKNLPSDISSELQKSLLEPKGTWEIRGEIYMPKKAFAKMNAKREEEGLETYANPRNISAGSMRQLDPRVTAERPLVFAAWRLETDLGQSSQVVGMDVLRLLGFKTNPGVYEKNLQEVKTYFEKMEAGREKLDYWIDGVVVRVNDLDQYESLGVVGKTPRGLVAWKFPAEEVTTIVKDVKWFVGRTGVLTPVAIFEPTSVAGTTVQHASLHNYDEIDRLDIRIGDTVIIYKAGDIIPKVKQVLTELRPKDVKKISIPSKCPVCDSDVSRKEGEVAIVCANRNCFAQDRERIMHVVRAFEIDGVGPQTIATLLENNLIQAPQDLFTLVAEELVGLDGFAEVAANKVVDEIQSKKEIDLPKFIQALGIKGVGEETAYDLAKQFLTLEAFSGASEEVLVEINGIGETVAESVSEFFKEPHNQEMIKGFQENGVQVQSMKQQVKTELDGKSFVLTGTLETISRDEAKELLRKRGASIGSTVSKKTDYVVVGESPGSKYEKAKTLGVPILNETAFLAILHKK